MVKIAGKRNQASCLIIAFLPERDLDILSCGFLPGVILDNTSAVCLRGL
ncbi:hypothetical protein [Endozoicomonas ascidiicola]|nr:hypothetical protein [Endozoicomonas ascidiicola]